ncbi:MAG: hypothetical protein E7446_05985 [Ruminococcaceae bacterium]|nr:hypothetical protein [Oscillospiraceae bacterium]
MNLERIFNICFTAASVLIISPFLLIRYEETIPRLVWDALTILLVATWGVSLVLYVVIKIRNRKEKKDQNKKK